MKSTEELIENLVAAVNEGFKEVQEEFKVVHGKLKEIREEVNELKTKR